MLFRWQIFTSKFVVTLVYMVFFCSFQIKLNYFCSRFFIVIAKLECPPKGKKNKYISSKSEDYHWFALIIKISPSFLYAEFIVCSFYCHRFYASFSRKFFARFCVLYLHAGCIQYAFMTHIPWTREKMSQILAVRIRGLYFLCRIRKFFIRSDPFFVDRSNRTVI